MQNIKIYKLQIVFMEKITIVIYFSKWANYLKKAIKFIF